MDKFNKVILVRAKERSGLIRARLLGFDVCTEEVAVFLDSHCEATDGKKAYRLSGDSINTGHDFNMLKVSGSPKSPNLDKDIKSLCLF